MSDKPKEIDAENSESAAAADNEGTAAKKKRSNKLIVIAAIVLVIAVGGILGWTWHEQPSFCNAFCHTPMDEYYDTYAAESGSATTDKYGNAVDDATGMLAVTHREADEGCLDCHVPTIGEMIGEGVAWVPGNYYYPLYERDLDDLTEARGLENDAFCLNGSCHHAASDGTPIENRDDLIAAGESQAFNPHSDHHGEFECTDCHKAHRASVNTCTRCHSEATTPPGWIDWTDAQKLDVYGNPDADTK